MTNKQFYMEIFIRDAHMGQNMHVLLHNKRRAYEQMMGAPDERAQEAREQYQKAAAEYDDFMQAGFDSASALADETCKRLDLDPDADCGRYA